VGSISPWFLCATVALAGACAAAAADESLPDAAATALLRSEVVVTATRTPTPVDEIATPVVVITRNEIERSLAGDVGTLLASRGGIEIARNGGPGQTATLFLRGTNSNHVTVLVDGVRINPGTIGGAAIQNIQPESVERIEIIKGARSSLYGTDAIGGVINIITRAGAAHGASLYAASGSYGTQVYAADAGGQLTQPLSAGASLVYQKSAGFPPYVGSSDPGDYLNRSANAQLRYALGDQLALRAQAWRASGNTAYSSFGTPANQDFINSNYAAGADWSDAASRSAHLTLGGVVDDIRQRVPGSPGLPADFARTRRDSLDAQASWRAAGVHELTVGGVDSNEHTDSLSYGQGFNVGTHALLLFAQDQLHRGPDDLLLALGYTHHEAFGTHGTWNAEYARALGSGLQATLAAGTAFHAPTSTDRFDIYSGNVALRPEVSQQAEVGLRWQPPGSQELRLDAYENRITDLIQYVSTGQFSGQVQNVARARIRGAELDWEWHAAAWRAHARYTLQDPRDLGSGQALLRRARENLALGGQYEAGPLYASADLQLAGPRTDYGGVALGGYALVSVGAGWHASARLSLQARVENALDRRYELASGYNTPGRTVTLAIRYRMR
jgi:vitamin B12 transporter